MKVKLEAGANLDFITKDEMREVMHEANRSWVAETSNGIRYARIYATGVIAGGVLNIGGALSTGELGPAPGFVWDIRRLQIVGLQTADVATIYMNDANPTSEIADTTSVTGKAFLWSEQVILYPGDSLWVVGTGLTATGTITVTGQVREVPVTLAWRLGN